MIRIGTRVHYVEGGKTRVGAIERNSMRTGRHIVRVKDAWYDRKSVWTTDEYDTILLEALESLSP